MKEIQLTRNKVTIIDDEDYLRVNSLKWYAQYALSTKSFYAARRGSKNEFGKRPILYLARYIMNCPVGYLVDHINRNTLDNRKENLRICTLRENIINSSAIIKTSKYKGVAYDKGINKWRVRCNYNGKQITIGYTKDEVEAAVLYDNNIKKYYGEFAVLNKELYPIDFTKVS